MQQRVAVTPWRNLNELLTVRDDIYATSGGAAISDDDNVSESQLQAVHMISAWAMRGRIPHSVQTTGLFMEALFNARNPSSSSFNIQAVYATAFSRFVTGFCDMSMANKVRLNMHQAASNIGMPAEWVDIRHEIAHGNQPRISILESATKDALTWLWDNFWARLEAGGRIEGLAEVRDVKPQLGYRSDRAGLPEVQNRVISIDTLDNVPEFLLKFVRSRIQEMSSDQEMPVEDSTTANVAYALIALCSDVPERLDRLASELLKPKRMIPEERKLGDSMEGAFLIWAPLVSTLCKYQVNFTRVLLVRMIWLLSEVESASALSDSSREAIYEWALRIASPIRRSSQKSIDISSPEYRNSDDPETVIVTECLLKYRNYWIDKLLHHVIRQGSVAFKRRWQRYE